MSLTEAIRERKVMTTISRTVKRIFLDANKGRFPIPENGSRGTMKRKVAQMLAINVTISSSEAEYRTLAQETCEGQWLLYLLHDFLVPHSSPIIMIYCDNQSAKHMAANPIFHERTKHIEIDCHVVRDKIQTGMLHPLLVSSKEKVADILTKSLHPGSLNILRHNLGMIDIYSSLRGMLKLV